MGLQTIQGHEVYVVDLKEMPALPIHGLTEEEQRYENIKDTVNRHSLGSMLKTKIPTSLLRLFMPTEPSTTGRYARALNRAFELEIITEEHIPGKFGIELVGLGFVVHKINE